MAAVAVACAVLITVQSLEEGLVRQTIENGTRLVLGHLQIQDAAFRKDQPHGPSAGVRDRRRRYMPWSGVAVRIGPARQRSPCCRRASARPARRSWVSIPGARGG
jgi:hypothetical protein